MKIKDIGAICRRGSALHIWDVADGDGTISQWIGDAAAVYPILGMPHLTQESVCRLLDIAPDDESKYYITAHPPEDVAALELNFADDCEGDEEAKMGDVTITYRGREFMPIYTERAIYFLDPQYAHPLRKEAEKAWIIRTNENGVKNLVMKSGFFVMGIISLYQPDRGVIDMLAGIVDAGHKILAESEARKAAEERERAVAAAEAEEAENHIRYNFMDYIKMAEEADKTEDVENSGETEDGEK